MCVCVCVCVCAWYCGSRYSTKVHAIQVENIIF